MPDGFFAAQQAAFYVSRTKGPQVAPPTLPLPHHFFLLSFPPAFLFLVSGTLALLLILKTVLLNLTS